MNKDQIVDFIKRNKRVVAIGSVAAVFLVSFSAFALLPRHHASQPVVTQAVSDTQVADAATPPRMVENATPFSFADLVERVSPAVVSVTAEEMQTDDQEGMPDNIPDPFRELFRQFNQGRPQPQPRKALSMGSGFIIDKSGLIVTNNHVIEGSKKIKVKLSDGRTFDAKLIGSDAATDVAVLRVTPDKPLPTVEFGNDRQLRVGDWVVAVGNPFGLSNTVTAGIVSSIGRDLGGAEQPYTDFIQIDAPINRGNSGGPTFDLRGQVIGMNSMIFSPSGGSVGIGFAIPASTIRETVAQLEAHGHVARGWLGVQIQSVTPEMAASLGIAQPKGAIVASVLPDSPAAKAGLRQGDVITAINGKQVEDSHDLTRRVASLSAGKTASFTVSRDGAAKVMSVTIGQKKDEQIASAGEPSSGGPGATGQAMGLGLAAVTPEVRRTYNIDDSVQGVLITKVDPDSDAADKGLQPGDVLVSVSNRSVHSPQDVEKTVAAAVSAGHKSVLLLVAGDGGSRFVAVDIGKT
ncbi:MAG: DegQ family serine endoprotease [Rhizomicrobium sp.]